MPKLNLRVVSYFAHIDRFNGKLSLLQWQCNANRMLLKRAFVIDVMRVKKILLWRVSFIQSKLGLGLEMVCNHLSHWARLELGLFTQD